MTLVRDAMLPDPFSLNGSASAQEAATHLVNPDVRAVLVVEDDGTLLGVVTEAALVASVVAAGRDPGSTPLRDIAVDIVCIDADLPVEDGYRILEDDDVERAAVVDDERLVGVLSRSGLVRRLAEDDAPPDEDPAHS